MGIMQKHYPPKIACKNKSIYQAIIYCFEAVSVIVTVHGVLQHDRIDSFAIVII